MLFIMTLMTIRLHSFNTPLISMFDKSHVSVGPPDSFLKDLWDRMHGFKDL